MLDPWASRRLDVARGFAEAAEKTGQLAVPVDEYQDVTDAVLRGDLWRELVLGREWSNQQCASWLAAVWNTSSSHELVGSSSPASPE